MRDCVILINDSLSHTTDSSSFNPRLLLSLVHPSASESWSEFSSIPLPCSSQFHRQERRQVPLLTKPLPLLTKPLHLLTKPRSGAHRQHRRRAPTQNFTCFTRDLLAQKCKYWRCVANRALGAAARCLAHPLSLLSKPLPLLTKPPGGRKSSNFSCFETFRNHCFSEILV